MEHIEELKIEIFKLFSVCPANTIIKGYIKDYLYTLLYEKKYYLSDYFLKDLYALKLLDIHNNSEILDFCWNIIEYNRYLLLGENKFNHIKYCRLCYYKYMEKDIIENKEAIYEYINDILIPWNIWEFNLNSDDIFNNKIRKYESKYY